MPEVSIVVSARDSFSPSVKNMISSMKGFSKEAEETAKEIVTLEKKQENLCERQAKLRVSMDEVKSSLSGARREFRQTGDEASRLNLEDAYKSFSKLSNKLSSCNREMREADKAMQELNSTQSKSSNRASADKSMFATLASAGFTKMAGDVIAQGANYYVGSAFGSDVGGMFGSTLSGAASGAAMGMPLGPAGAAVGGLIGGVAGFASGGLNIAQRQDDAFKGAVQSEYDRLTQENVSMVSSGINVSARREIDQNAFSKMLGGDDEAKKFLGWVKDTAADTPMGYDDLTQMSRRLKTYGYDTEEVKDMLLTIGDTGAGTGSDVQGMLSMITGLGRIKQSGKTSLENLNPMIDRGVEVWSYLQEGLQNEAKVDKTLNEKLQVVLGRDSLGELTLQDVQKLSSTNQIDAEKAVGYIMDGMAQDFGGLMEQQAKTFTGLTSTLEDMRSNIEAAAGDGFSAMRKPAMEQQAEHYDIMGNRYEEAAEISGKLMAVQENRQERILRERMTALFNGSDDSGYADAVKTVDEAESALAEAEKSGSSKQIAEAEDKLAIALAETQRLIDAAEGQAETLYKGSEMEKSIENSSIGLINSLQGFLKEDNVWKTWGYNIGIEMGRGMMSVAPEGGERDLGGMSPYERYYGWENSGSPNPYGSYGLGSSYSIGSPTPYGQSTIINAPPKAFGMQRVPYDNFPALLHQGERVLTASEARTADSGGNIAPITITGNQFTVREEADIDRIAAELARKLEKASVIYAN